MHGLGGLLGYAGLAAAAAVLATCWGHLRGLYAQLSNRFVVSFSTTGHASVSMGEYLSREFKLSKFSRRRYDGACTFVRPLDKIAVVGIAVPSASGLLFWKGWKPILIRRACPQAGGGKTQDIDYNAPQPHCTVTFIRGTFSHDDLVQTAIDYHNALNDTQAATASKRSRFFIRHLEGTADQQALIAGMNDRPVSGGPVYAAGQASPEAHCMGRILRWQREDLGPRMEQDYNPILDLILPPELEEAVAEIQQWLAHRDWYRQKRLRWKRGWLLYGPPGTGKTSLIRGIGMQFDLPIFSYSLSTFRDGEFRKAWREMGTNTPCIALIEDIDCAFNGRERKTGAMTFDCLLNCLDGVEQVEGVFVIVTTNKIEQIDEGLGGAGTPRPGRVDRVFELPLLDKAGQRRLAARLLEEWPEAQAEAIAALPERVPGAVAERACGQLAEDLFWSHDGRTVRQCENCVRPAFAATGPYPIVAP